MKYYIRICLVVLVLVLACSPYIQLQKRVLFSSPSLNAVDICSGGICVLPFWDIRRDTVITWPDIEEIEKLIRQAGHRQLKLISYNKMVKKLEKNAISPYMLLDLEKNAFADKPFCPSKELIETLTVQYFLRFAIQGEAAKMLNGREITTIQFEAGLFYTASCKIIWHAQVICRGEITERITKQELIKEGLMNLTELLPINPKISYINPKDETW